MLVEQIDYLRLIDFAHQVFLAMGCSPIHATYASQNLIRADLRGIDSHGIARLSGYVRLWEAGRINAKPKIEVVRGFGSIATIDADGALGLVAAQVAMEKALELAENHASGFVAVRNSNHFGIAGQYALMATEKQMMGMATTNASPLVVPANGAERRLGTNPIAIALPAGKYKPFVADFATTAAANGKLEILQRKGLDTPDGWLVDKSGDNTNSPYGVRDGGALLPLGSYPNNSYHKGTCLGSIVDILSGVMSGANFLQWVPPFVSFLQPLPDAPGKGIGHWFGAWKIDAFAEMDTFNLNMEKWVEAMLNCKQATTTDPVTVPGMPEWNAEADRLKNGIPVLEMVLADIAALEKKFSIKF